MPGFISLFPTPSPLCVRRWFSVAFLIDQIELFVNHFVVVTAFFTKD